MSQLFASGGQNIGVSALASFLPKKSQGCSPSEWTGWISLQSKGLSRVFSNTTVQKHQFFSLSISPSKEIPGLISFRMDWLDLLAVQGTLKSLLQYHSSKASILQPQHQSFQRNPRADLLQNGLVGSPCSPRDSQESSPIPQFKSINSSASASVLPKKSQG